MLINVRCRCGRHHEAKSQWLLHCCCGFSPTPLYTDIHLDDTFQVGPCCDTQDAPQGQRLQRSKSREDQGGYCQTPGVSSFDVCHTATQLARNNTNCLSNNQPSASGFITAVELSHNRKRVCKISTGSKQLDSILGG